MTRWQQVFVGVFMAGVSLSIAGAAGVRSVIVLCAHVGFVRVEENTIVSTSFIHRDTARSRGSASSWSATPGQ